jgi:Trypsin
MPRGGLRGLTGSVALLALCLVVAVPTPAQAVIDGKFDGTEHPNVAIIVGCDDLCDELGPVFICTGTLVAPSTVLTAAHCVTEDFEGFPISDFDVSFEPEARVNPLPAPFELKNPIHATPDPHPGWTWEGLAAVKGSAGFLRYQEQDVGLLHLEQPAADVYPGIAPAPIVGAGALNAIRNGSKPTITQVGYGLQRSGPPGQEDSFFTDITRNQSTFPLSKLRDKLAFGHANPNDAHGYGFPSQGDSGSPWFLNGSVAVLYSFGGINNGAGGARLDTGPARAFLRSRGLVP